MTARSEFSALVARQLAEAYRRGAADAAQLLNGNINRHKLATDMHPRVSEQQEAIVRGGQALAATVTGAALRTVAEPAGDAAVVGLVTACRYEPRRLAVPVQRQVTR